MKRVVAVCLGLLLLSSVALGSVRSLKPQHFELANQVGEGKSRTYFLFTTSVGLYTVRYDGMVEVSIPSVTRRRHFWLNGRKEPVKRVYFLEHEGDLLLLYEVSGGSSYLLRLDQVKRKSRWSMAVTTTNAPPVIDGDVVSIDNTAIDVANGRVVNQP